MVSVSLLKLVAIAGTEPVWPDEFAGKFVTLKDEPNDRSAWGVIADWCDENDEPELGRACRWLSKRAGLTIPGTNVSNSRPAHMDPPHWTISGLPRSVAAAFVQSVDRSTLAGLAAELAAALAEVDKATT